MAVTSNPTPRAQFDIILDGTWVILPSVNADGNIVGVDIYSPSCGHPHGAAFVNQIPPNPWPAPVSFNLLNDHSHVLSIRRDSAQKAGMHIRGIDQAANHCLGTARRCGSNWDVMISIDAGPDVWTSSDTILPQTKDPAGNPVSCLSGRDAPSGYVSGLQTLSFYGVTDVEFCGATSDLQSQFPSPWKGIGSLILEGEIPYIPTIQHERAAFDAIANLAGIDLALDYRLPRKDTPPGPQGIRPHFHTGMNCGYTVIVMPS